MAAPLLSDMETATRHREAFVCQGGRGPSSMASQVAWGSQIVHPWSIHTMPTIQFIDHEWVHSSAPLEVISNSFIGNEHIKSLKDRYIIFLKKKDKI